MADGYHGNSRSFNRHVDTSKAVDRIVGTLTLGNAGDEIGLEELLTLSSASAFSAHVRRQFTASFVSKSYSPSMHRSIMSSDLWTILSSVSTISTGYMNTACGGIISHVLETVRLRFLAGSSSSLRLSDQFKNG